MCIKNLFCVNEWGNIKGIYDYDARAERLKKKKSSLGVAYLQMIVIHIDLREGQLGPLTLALGL